MQAMQVMPTTRQQRHGKLHDRQGCLDDNGNLSAGPFTYTGSAHTRTATVSGAGGLSQPGPSFTATTRMPERPPPVQAMQVMPTMKAAATGKLHDRQGGLGDNGNLYRRTIYIYRGCTHTLHRHSNGAGGLSQTLTVSYSNNTDAGTGPPPMQAMQVMPTMKAAATRKTSRSARLPRRQR